MREILEYCVGGSRQNVPAGSVVVHEGGRTGHLYVLIEGRLEVIKGDTVVASITEPGAVLGEMSVLLDQPHTATVRAASDSVIYEIGDAASFLAGAQRIHDAVHEVVARFGGTISAEHGIGRLKRAELAKYKSPVALETMRAIKRALDPHGILNPGKVLPD